MTLLCIMRLSYKNSARNVLLATIPPTFAAVRNTYSGLSRVKKPTTALVSRRSNSDEVLRTRFENPSIWSCLRMAEPTAISSTNSSNSRYAAESAASSLKRARHLFSNVDSVFVPAHVDSIEAEIVRRRERLQPLGGLSSSRSSTGSGASLKLMTNTIAPGVGGILTTASTTTSSAVHTTETTTGNSSAIHQNALVHKSSMNIPTPTWHAPWKLSTVLSSHLGWVRCIFSRCQHLRRYAR